MSEELLDTLPDEARPASTSLMPHRFRTTCWFTAQPVPVKYSSTVELRLGSTKKRYTETVDLKTRLLPQRYGETAIALISPASRRFTSAVEIKCLPPAPTILSLQDLEDAQSEA